MTKWKFKVCKAIQFSFYLYNTLYNINKYLLIYFKFEFSAYYFRLDLHCFCEHCLCLLI